MDATDGMDCLNVQDIQCIEHLKDGLNEPLVTAMPTFHYEQCDVNKEPSGCDIDMKFNGLYEKAAAKAICR